MKECLCESLLAKFDCEVRLVRHRQSPEEGAPLVRELQIHSDFSLEKMGLSQPVRIISILHQRRLVLILCHRLDSKKVESNDPAFLLEAYFEAHAAQAVLDDASEGPFFALHDHRFEFFRLLRVLCQVCKYHIRWLLRRVVQA